MSRIKTHNHHFRVMYSKEDMEDILSYNKILDYIKHESNSEDGPLWQYVISIHQHPDTLAEMAANTTSRWNGKQVKLLMNH